jgi:lysophospholipase L1-like esterase
MLLEPGQKIVFIGDSITDCDRRGAAAPYGDGYMSMVRSLLLARYPQYGLTFVNRGVSGDTTRDLARRWERDVIAQQPDWLAVMIGINDVWRAFGGNPAEAVPLPEYTTTLRGLLDRTRAATGARLILMEPYMIEPDPRQPMRRQMDLFGAAVRQLATDYAAVLVRTQVAFDTALAHTTPADWADDQIHPNGPGHAIIALAVLRAIGFALEDSPAG